MLQSSCLKDHMKTIGIYQLVRNGNYFENSFLNTIKKIYQHAGKCNDQQKFKDIVEAAMVFNLE